MQLRLVDFNYAFQDATTLSSSSADTEFPLSNLKRAIRSRVLRTTGNYVITSGSNDKMNFNVGGSELTATVSAGTYTATTLAAAIVTALNAASAGTYTAARSSATGKWTITKSAGTFELLTNTGTNVATSIWSTIGFSTASDNTGALTYTGASIALHTEEWVVLDLSSSEEVDSFAMFFDPISGPKLSNAATLRLQANATNTWASPAVDVALSIDNDFDVVSHFFSSSQTYRYWRVKIVDPANANLYVELGKIVLGKGTQLTYMPANAFEHQVMDQSKTQENDYGHRYTDIYPPRKSFSIEYQALPYTDVKTLEQAYRRNGKTTPVLLAMDPTAEFYDKDHFLLYCFFDSDLGQKHVINGNFSQGFKFLEAM